MTVKVVGSVILVVCGLLFLLSIPGSVCAAGSCPDLPSGGGQTMSATAKTTATSCPVTNGMYVRTFTTLQLDAIATAFGQCQVYLPDCSGLSCVCVPGFTQERTINHIYSWGDITSKDINGTYELGNVFDSTGFGHVLDTTQGNTSGPLPLFVASPGEYFLHFQANINMTACNILPATTPIYDIMVHVRTTFHRGERTNGSLVGGMNLLDPGIGYYQERGTDTKNTDDWGGAEAAISLIQTVGAQWFQSHPTPRMGILDISREMGGPFSPHTEHQNGLDIDIRYVRNDGAELGVDLSIQNQKKKYSKPLTVELLRKFAANGSLHRILVSPKSNITSADVPGVSIVQVSGHDNHFHVSLVDPDGPDTNNCP